MTDAQYYRLRKELQQLSKMIPLTWGRVQNNRSDAKIDMFSCSSIDELETEIKDLTITDKNYLRRRWFLWMCSKVDEYLFYREPSVGKNPNSKDKTWDIEFHPNLRFDLKGTVVPRLFRDQFNTNNEQKLIHHYYENQSRGVRYGIQNRLFIVHHSYRKTEREMFLRCHWKLKEEAYRKFIALVNHSKIDCIKFGKALAKCIFIIESKQNQFHFKINQFNE